MRGGIWKLAALACAGALAATAPGLAEAGPLDGVWKTGNLSHVTIRACPEGHCGYVTKVSVPPQIYEKYGEAIDRLGKDNLIDYINRDPQLRHRRIKGLQVLTLESQDSPDTYRGAVYNPEDGNTYTGVVEVIDSKTLRLTGCGFFDLICKSEDWVRIK